MFIYQHIHTCPHCGFSDPLNSTMGDKGNDKCNYCGKPFKKKGNYFSSTQPDTKECHVCGSSNLEVYKEKPFTTQNNKIVWDYEYKCEDCGALQ